MHPRTDTLNAMRAQFTAQLRAGFTVEARLVKEVEARMAVKVAEMADGDVGEYAGMKRKASVVKGRAKKRVKVSIYDEEQEEDEWVIDVS